MSPVERLQKLIAAAGIASRREAEQMISQGRVQVNGRIILEQGVKADPAVDQILVDGVPLPKSVPSIYVMLNKPVGVLSTVGDERGRKTVRDLVPMRERVYPVGRLDAESEGLILLTNDGELTERLTHPRFGHTREYRVLVGGIPTEADLGRLRHGVMLDDGPTGPAEVEILPSTRVRQERLPLAEGDACWLSFVIREGRKRQVRRMCEVIGHPVLRLIRVAMGPLRLGDLAPGQYRALTQAEIAKLKAATAGAPPTRHTVTKPAGQTLLPRAMRKDRITQRGATAPAREKEPERALRKPISAGRRQYVRREGQK